MSVTQVDGTPAPPGGRYPMLRAGGAFLVCVGLGLIGGIAFSGAAPVNFGVFYAGAAAGVIALCFAGRLSTGTPTRLQIAALAGAVLLELLLFAVQGRMLPRGTEEHVRWLWISGIVGVHFLPMAISFGPRFAVLGLACILNAVLGLLATSVPYEVFGLVDGALKLGFGAWSLVGAARSPSTSSFK
jgi:uncharacterized membrane protein YdcZ (DUF606 family)